MESTADPRLTRQSIVRLTQMFDALQALLPLRTSDTDPSPPSAMLRVRLCGTASEYRALQSEIGIRVANPAFYVPSRRLLVAGSDMPAIIEQERIASEALARTAPYSPTSWPPLQSSAKAWAPHAYPMPLQKQ